MKSSQSTKLKWIRNSKAIPSTRNEKKNEIAGFPLNGPIHPSTIAKHQRMKDLKSNEMNFAARDLIEMLDVPSKGHFTKHYLNLTNGTNSGQPPQVHRAPKGI